MCDLVEVNSSWSRRPTSLDSMPVFVPSALIYRMGSLNTLGCVRIGVHRSLDLDFKLDRWRTKLSCTCWREDIARIMSDLTGFVVCLGTAHCPTDS